jgi:hypothetical protein
MIGSSMSLLGPPPAQLAPLPRALHAALDDLLSALRPPLVDRPMTRATARDDGIEVVIAHATVIAFAVWVQASSEAIVVGCGALHAEHHDAAGAVQTVAQLLCAEREVPGYDGAPLRPDFGCRR